MDSFVFKIKNTHIKMLYLRTIISKLMMFPISTKVIPLQIQAYLPIVKEQEEEFIMIEGDIIPYAKTNQSISK